MTHKEFSHKLMHVGVWKDYRRNSDGAEIVKGHVEAGLLGKFINCSDEQMVRYVANTRGCFGLAGFNMKLFNKWEARKSEDRKREQSRWPSQMPAQIRLFS